MFSNIVVIFTLSLCVATGDSFANFFIKDLDSVNKKIKKNKRRKKDKKRTRKQLRNKTLTSESFFSRESMKRKSERAIEEAKKHGKKLRNLKKMLKKIKESDNEVYRKIADEFKDNYKEIAGRQIQSLEIKPKGPTHMGINFSRGFANFSVDLKREVAADLFDDERYLVIDHLIISIDATKLLGNLRDKGLVRITEKQFASYAGITFKRKYRYVHFADSYINGLKKDLDKLFFNFLYFRGDREFLKLKPYEFISREDSISGRVGAMAGGPIIPGKLSVGIGAVGSYEKLSKVSMQAIGEADDAMEGEKFRISYEKKKGRSFGASATLQADFIKFLQLSILRFDFTYEYSDSYRMNLSFRESDIPNLRSKSKLLREVASVLKKGSGDLNILMPYVVSRERRRSENKRSRYALLIFGGAKECNVEHIQVATDSAIKNFFRHAYSVTRYQDNNFSRKLSAIMKKILRWDKSMTNVMSDTKTVCMEYESDTNLIKDKGDLVFNSDEEKLTLDFKQQYYSKKVNKRNRGHCMKILNNCSGVSPIIVDNFRKGLVRGPINIRTSFIMNREAINHFNKLEPRNVYDIVDNICYKYDNPNKRRYRQGHFYQQVQYAQYRVCKYNLKNSYDKYIKELVTADYSFDTYKKCRNHRKIRRWRSKSRKWRMAMSLCMQRISTKTKDQFQCEIPVWRLKKFVEYFHNESEDKNNMYELFGLSNVFFHGSVKGHLGRRTVSGKVKKGSGFSSCFQEGEFSGTGLVDNYMRKKRVRAPASLLHED